MFYCDVDVEEVEWMIDIIRLAVGVSVLGYAAYSDIRERAVYSFVWLIMGSVGYILAVYQFAEDIHAILPMVAAAVVFYYWYIDNPPIWVTAVAYIISFLLALLGLLGNTLSHNTWVAFSVYLVTLLAIVLHSKGVIKGRADARALMAIAALNPTYPEVGQLLTLSPLARGIAEVTMPFALLTLFYAAVSALSVPLYLGIRNAMRGDVGFPEMFIGYRMPVHRVPSSHVWLMERVEGSDVVLHLRPSEVDDIWDEVAKLEAKGRKKVWVQPKVPFVVFMFIGYLLAYFVGYPMAFLTP